MKRIQKICPVLIFLFVLSCEQKPKETTQPKKATAADTTQPTVPEMAVNTYASVDVSPMDMSYFPVEYTKMKMANGNVPPPVVRVVYSRPHLQKRRLFDGILKYDEPWRLGANESTEIDIFKPVTIQGKKVQPGRYILYCIPRPDKWTIVLNSNIDTWGLKQDPTKDIDHFDIPITTNNPLLEYFTMVFEKADKGANLVIAWDDVVGKLPIEF